MKKSILLTGTLFALSASILFHVGKVYASDDSETNVYYGMKFVLVLGSFKDENNAENYLNKIKDSPELDGHEIISIDTNSDKNYKKRVITRAMDFETAKKLKHEILQAGAIKGAWIFKLPTNGNGKQRDIPSLNYLPAINTSKEKAKIIEGIDKTQTHIFQDKEIFIFKKDAKIFPVENNIAVSEQDKETVVNETAEVVSEPPKENLIVEQVAVTNEPIKEDVTVEQSPVVGETQKDVIEPKPIAIIEKSASTSSYPTVTISASGDMYYTATNTSLADFYKTMNSDGCAISRKLNKDEAPNPDGSSYEWQSDEGKPCKLMLFSQNEEGATND